VTFVHSRGPPAARTLEGPAEEDLVTFQVYSHLTQVTSGLRGPGPVELYAVKTAGSPTPLLLVEAYADDAIVAAGELAVWDLNQALAALLSETSQARRMSLREDGRGRGGYLDVVTGDAGTDVEVFVTSRDGGRRATYRSTATGLAADLNGVLHHYLDLTRNARRTIVLPEPNPAAVG